MLRTAFLSGVAAFVLEGCGHGSQSKAVGGRACGGRAAPWCESMWSKEYSAVFSPSGFDDFVAGCPWDESRFYDRGSTMLAGKYEWYCASRGKYLERPPRQAKLMLVGFYLVPSPLESLPVRSWTSGSFSELVRFTSDFYPLADGQCYVDFAAPKVGGGVFRRGLAQEEKLLLQLPELLVVLRERSAARRPLYLSSKDDGRHRNTDVLVFKDVIRPVATLPKAVDLQCGWPPKSAWPCADYAATASTSAGAVVTMIAINAEEFESDGYYNPTEFGFLANKILAAFAAAGQAGCRSLNSGPLGAGVFNGNMDLAVALHATMAVAFDMPVTMWGIHSASSEVTTITQWIAQAGSMSVATVLRKLQRGISWGHGQSNKGIVQLDKGSWDAA